MSMRRRDFVKLAGVTALGASPLKGLPGEGTGSGQVPLEDQGRHPVLEKDHPYVFIDSCMQIWPDADFTLAHRHGVTTYSVTAWNPHIPIDQALEGLMYWHWVARSFPHISVVEAVDDIFDAKKRKGTSLLLASQCGDFIDYELHRIEAFYRMGLRMLIPAYSADNRICGGCLDRADTGLSAFGEKVVEECNRVGLLLDCSHLSRRSSLEIIERSGFPAVFSHSGVKALSDNPRNIDDAQIKACAAKGGVVGLSPWGPMVLKQGQTARPTLEEFIRHIDHVAQMLGSPDSIGIGTDMSLGTYPDHAHDPWGDAAYRDVTGAYNQHVTENIRSPQRMVQGFSFFPEVLNLVAGLKKRGYSESAVRKILGENYLRVFRQVWK